MIVVVVEGEGRERGGTQPVQNTMLPTWGRSVVPTCPKCRSTYRKCAYIRQVMCPHTANISLHPCLYIVCLSQCVYTPQVCLHGVAMYPQGIAAVCLQATTHMGTAPACLPQSKPLPTGGRSVPARNRSRSTFHGPPLPEKATVHRR